MNDYIEIIGPCSKYEDGKGWVTRIPVQLLENAGFVRKEPTINEIRIAHGLPPIEKRKRP